jgi:FkbM family methyltransferase
LTENVRVNDCLQTVQIEDSALGDVRTVGKAILPKVRNYGMVSVRPDEDGDLKIALLDDFIFDDSAIGIIKLDVEGNELPVLRGAIKTIERHKPHIFIEIADEPELANFKEFLSAFGYGVKGRYCATPTYLFSPS